MKNEQCTNSEWFLVQDAFQKTSSKNGSSTEAGQGSKGGVAE
jgi:hypothetical protein